MCETWAIILAAGRSDRMGTNKLLMPFSDRTIIETVIGNAMQSEADKIMVVIGAYRDELLPVIKRMKVNFIYNENWQNGMLSSIKCAFLNLPAEADSVLICLGDQPAIPGSVATDLIHKFRKNSYGIVIPVYNGKRGHPVLISRSYEQQIYDLDNNTGLHELMKNNADDILEVQTTVRTILKDIDTMKDYEALTELN